MISLFRFGCNNKAMNERIHCYGFCERHSELRVSRALTSNINSNFSIFHIFFSLLLSFLLCSSFECCLFLFCASRFPLVRFLAFNSKHFSITSTLTTQIDLFFVVFFPFLCVCVKLSLCSKFLMRKNSIPCKWIDESAWVSFFVFHSFVSLCSVPLLAVVVCLFIICGDSLSMHSHTRKKKKTAEIHPFFPSFSCIAFSIEKLTINRSIQFHFDGRQVRNGYRMNFSNSIVRYLMWFVSGHHYLRFLHSSTFFLVFFWPFRSNWKVFPFNSIGEKALAFHFEHCNDLLLWISLMIRVKFIQTIFDFELFDIIVEAKS